MLYQENTVIEVPRELNSAQRKVAAFLTRPLLHFAAKPAEQPIAEQKWAEEEEAIAEEQAKPAANIKIGARMPDGSICAGISPSTNQPLFVTDKDAPLRMEFIAAAKYARDLEANTHKDWRIPTKEELDMLFRNREKGALKGTFNLTGKGHISLYWSSTPGGTNYAWCQKFDDGRQTNYDQYLAISVRCVRG